LLASGVFLVSLLLLESLLLLILEDAPHVAGILLLQTSLLLFTYVMILFSLLLSTFLFSMFSLLRCRPLHDVPAVADVPTAADFSQLLIYCF
jgi:hypothetical protein